MFLFRVFQLSTCGSTAMLLLIPLLTLLMYNQLGRQHFICRVMGSCDVQQPFSHAMGQQASCLQKNCTQSHTHGILLFCPALLAGPFQPNVHTHSCILSSCWLAGHDLSRASPAPPSPPLRRGSSSSSCCSLTVYTFMVPSSRRCCCCCCTQAGLQEN